MSPRMSSAFLIRAGAATGVAFALISGTAIAASAAAQEPGLAAQFVAKINSERTANGRPALGSSSALTSAAARWAATMASRNVLAHNPNLAGEVRGWHYLGENVGVGYSVSSLESAFWESAEHRSNILDPHYTRIGVAVVDVDGKLWVAEEFERPYADSTGTSTASRRAATAERASRSQTRSPLGHVVSRPAARLGQPNRCTVRM